MEDNKHQNMCGGKMACTCGDMLCVNKHWGHQVLRYFLLILLVVFVFALGMDIGQMKASFGGHERGMMQYRGAFNEMPTVYTNYGN